MRQPFCHNTYSSFDYYPFGMIMPGRAYSANNGYRFGFNKGSEKDNENYGEGNAYTTEFRELDVRLGVWCSIDPKAKASESPYVGFGDNPIYYNDPLGDTASPVIFTPPTDKAYDYDVTVAKKEDNDAVNLYSHGTQYTILIPNPNSEDRKKNHYKWSGDPKEIANAIDHFIMPSTAKDWKNGKTALVIHSCQAGRNKKDGTPGIAQLISKAYPNAIVIAADERITVTSSGAETPYKEEGEKDNGTLTKRDKKGNLVEIDTNEKGHWHVFKGGKEIEEYDGDWHPKANPNWFDKLLHKMQIN